MQIKTTGLRREIVKGHSPSRIRTKKIIKSNTLQDGRATYLTYEVENKLTLRRKKK